MIQYLSISTENIVNKVIKYIDYIKENSLEKLDRKNGFFMYLNLIDEMKMTFIKTSHYLNNKDYQYFFTTEHIKNKEKFTELFDKMLSLQTTCGVAQGNTDKRLSFYFGVRNNKLEYGFQDDSDRDIMKTGEFDVDYRVLRGLRSFKCLSLIQGILAKSRLFNLNLLQDIKNDLEYWLEGNGEILIFNEEIVTKTIDKEDIKEVFEDVTKLLYKYEKWCEGFKWFNKIHFYIDAEDEKVVTFYIKIKNKKSNSEKF